MNNTHNKYVSTPDWFAEHPEIQDASSTVQSQIVVGGGMIGSTGGSDSEVSDMFVWDKKYAAFGFDPITNMAYSYTNGKQDFVTNENDELIPVMIDDESKWLYDDTLSDKWIIKTTKQKFSILDGLMEYDSDKDCFLFHKNIVTSGGVTMYAKLDDIDVPSIYDGLPIDSTTLRWKYDEESNTKMLTVIKTENEDKGIESIENGEVIARKFINGLEVSNGGKKIIVNKRSLIVDDIPDLSSLYVNLVDDQTINGWKDFITGIKFNGLSMYNLKDDVVFLDANLVVSGGVTMYGAADDVDVPNLLDSIPIAGTKTPGLASFNSEHFTVNEEGMVSLQDTSKSHLAYKINIKVNGSAYSYDGSEEITIPIDYSTLGLDAYYLKLTNIETSLENKGYHKIVPITNESKLTEDNILYIII